MVPSLRVSPRTIGAGCTQWPTPELASECHGNFSPGSFLRDGATSECAEHAMRRHLAAEHDAAAQRDHGGDLAQRKFRIAPVMAAIDDLDADRTGIDVFFAGPGRHAGMPGALGFRDALHDAAVFQHDVMGGDVGARACRAARSRLPRRACRCSAARSCRAGGPCCGRRNSADGMTSEAIEESGVNVFMFALALGNREGALTLRIKTIGCERTKRHRTTQTGQENGNSDDFTGRTSFTIPLRCRPAQCASRPAASHFGRVCAGSITGPAQASAAFQRCFRDKPQSCNRPINAFLTLTAVTKW